MRNKLLAFVLAAAPASAFAQSYALGTLNINTSYGSTNILAASGGMAVGVTSNRVNGVNHGDIAFVWTPTGGMQSMGIPGVGPNGQASSFGVAAANGVAYGYGQKWSGSTQIGTRSYVWDPIHGAQDMGNLGTEANGTTRVEVSLAEGSNAYGTASSYVGGAHGASQAFVWDKTNGIRSLGSLGGANGTSTPYAVSNGNVVGSSSTSKGDRAFIWDSTNGMRSLGTLSLDNHGDGRSYAQAVDGNMAFGYYQSYVGSSSKGTRAFAWDSVHGMINIGTLSTNLSGVGNSKVTSASGGLAFGYCEKWVGNTFEGYQSFVWDSVHGISNVGTLGVDATGFESTQLTGSDNGVAFGNAYSPTAGSDRAVIWDSTHGLVDMNIVLAHALPTGWILTSTDAMKDGWIYGRAQTPNGLRSWAYHAVPEPASFAAFGLGLVGVIARKRRK